MPLLVVLFIFVPLVEIWGILQVGSWIGAWPTLTLIVLTALTGSALLKQQGLHTLTKARSKLDMGEMPLQEILEGLLLAIAGALLLTPGFFTDFAGIFLLLPAGRRLIIESLSRRIISQGSYSTTRTSHQVFEGEFHREE